MPSNFGMGVPAFSPADARPMAGALLDVPRPTAGALLAKSDRIFAELLKRFDGLLALSRTESADLAAAAAQKFQMSVETEGLIKAATDVLDLTRTLKQLWIQGELNVATTKDDAEDEALQQSVERIENKVGEMLVAMSRDS